MNQWWKSSTRKKSCDRMLYKFGSTKSNKVAMSVLNRAERMGCDWTSGARSIMATSLFGLGDSSPYDGKETLRKIAKLSEEIAESTLRLRKARLAAKAAIRKCSIPDDPAIRSQVEKARWKSCQMQQQFETIYAKLLVNSELRRERLEQKMVLIEEMMAATRLHSKLIERMIAGKPPIIRDKQDLTAAERRLKNLKEQDELDRKFDSMISTRDLFLNREKLERYRELVQAAQREERERAEEKKSGKTPHEARMEKLLEQRARRIEEKARILRAKQAQDDE